MKSIIQFWLGHGLAKRRLLLVFWKFVHWQFISRIKQTHVVPFATKSKLIVKKGMTGATGNIYCGLHEFEDMGFLLHAMRGEDCFVDVGANIGSYTILASSEIGTETYSFEPIPVTFSHLETNIRENNAVVHAHNSGVGHENGILTFTEERDTVNHVIPNGGKGIKVPVIPLDDVQFPNKAIFVKIDVEGFEKFVIDGGVTLFGPSGKAVALIIELNGSGKRYDISDFTIHEKLVQDGYEAHLYDPIDRKLTSISKPGHHNTIYIRREKVQWISERTKSARTYKILGIEF